MVLIEEEAPEEEQQKPQQIPKSASPVTEQIPKSEAAPVRTDSKDQSSSEIPKSKKNEGDGWETASEGSEDDATKNKVATSTSGNNEEQFEDALTEEELRAKAISVANATKAQGNTLYAAGKFSEALDCYGSALEGVANDPNANELRAQCYSNRAICEIKLQNYAAAVTESTKALELDPKYVKALIRRSEANENLKKFEEALSDLKKALELDPSNKAVRASIIRLEPIVAKKREEMKDEMIGKLKELGSNVLGKFGMSMDDFKAVKDPNTGSYSISFGK
jgi:tetratricopeptide (TPR) repeat protein